MIYLLTKPHHPSFLGRHLPPDDLSLGQSLSDPHELYKQKVLYIPTIIRLFSITDLDDPKKRQDDRGIDTEIIESRSNFMVSVPLLTDMQNVVLLSLDDSFRLSNGESQ